ncbi:MAG: bifunctional nuclease family protein [Candidatus Omnitrophota bacterium]|nr:MAG: bifunctional nuclease family protein [Candidatus Omnitrophota bacterium]
MVEVELCRIVIDEAHKEQIIVFKEKSGSRTIPVVIGLNEAAAIRLQLNGFIPPRPLTHDLMRSLLEVLGAVLEKVVIDNLVDNTFHAKLYLKIGNDGARIVDARPSDSVALAVRMKSPIFVEEEVFDKLS